MTKWFQILLSSTSLEERPPLSEKVRDYLEFFFSKELQNSKIGKSQWKSVLSILYVSGGNHKLINTVVADASRTITSETTKLYEIHIPLSLINKSEDQHRKSIEVLLDAIFLFCKRFSKLKDAQIQEISNKVDWAYLLSLPYPAFREEQGYLEDRIGSFE